LQPAVPERANKDVDLTKTAEASHFLDEGAIYEEVNLTRAAGAIHFLTKGATDEEIDLKKTTGEEGARIFLFFI
jgi:hypothetical protein